MFEEINEIAGFKITDFEILDVVEFYRNKRF